MEERRLIVVALQDFANVMTALAWVMRVHHGWDTRVVCVTRHPFEYPIPHDLDAGLRPNDEWLAQCKHWVFSEEAMPDTTYSYANLIKAYGFTIPSGARTYVFHAGTQFRHSSHRYTGEQGLDRSVPGFTRRIVQGDLLRLVPDDERAITSVLFGKPITSQEFVHTQITNRDQSHVVITHTPTSQEYKGTKFIRSAIRRLFAEVPGATARVRYVEIGGDTDLSLQLTYSKVFKKRAQAHFYIDSWSSVYGYMGVSCVEAMACGTIALAAMHNFDQVAFRQFAGDADAAANPIIALPGSEHEDENALFDAIRTILMDMNFEEIQRRSDESKLWVNRVFSAERYARWFFTNVLVAT